MEIQHWPEEFQGVILSRTNYNDGALMSEDRIVVVDLSGIAGENIREEFLEQAGENGNAPEEIRLPDAVAGELLDSGDDDEHRPSTLATLLAANIGVLALSCSLILMARGGNYKVVRQNLLARGKANSKEPMPQEQRKLRRRKRRKK